MMKRLLLVLFLLVFASPALAAWPGPWKRTVAEALAATGSAVASVTNGAGVILLAASAAPGDNDESPQMKLDGNNGHSICLMTDTTATGNGSGALAVEVFWMGMPDETEIDYFTLVFELTLADPCRWDVAEGEVILKANGASDSNAIIVIRANHAN